MNMGRAATLWLAGVPAAAAVRDTAVAVGLLEIGSLPGQAARAEVVADLALWTLLLGGALLPAVALSGRASRALAGPLLPFVSLAAGCFAAAHLLSFDPYYAPGEIRFAASASFGAGWYVAAGALAAGAAALAWRRPRAGLVGTGAALLFAGVMLVGAGLH